MSPIKLTEGDNSYDNQTKLVRLAASQGLNEDAESKTPKFDIPGICRTCVHACITKRGDVEHSEVRIKCSELNQVMPHDIMECTSYWKRGQLSLLDMAELAYLVDAREGPPSWEKGV